MAEDTKKPGGEDMSPVLMEAVELVRSHVTACENSVAFITERVAIHIFSLIRKCRRNYWGVFEEPTDPHTKRAKVWVPLTEVTVSNVVKNYDLDQKDVNFRARNPNGTEMTDITRAKAQEEMDKMFFGEKLDELEQATNIDGTGIWKILKAPKMKGEKGKKQPLVEISLVDRLNFFISSTAHSIQEADVAERIVVTRDMVAGTNWDNKDAIVYTKDVPPSDRQLKGSSMNGAPAEFAEAFEFFGMIPTYFVARSEEESAEKKAKSKGEKRQGHIVVSNPFSNPVVHLIEFWDDWKPYEENWCTRVPGRWDGRGTAEKLIMLQLWLNTVVNLRINRNTLAQLGLLKVRRGSGITAQILQRLASTGTVPVNDMKDIEQMVVQEAGAGSYNDENFIKQWAREVTSAYESATGESLPSSTPATNAALQSKAAGSQFQMMREQLGMFLQRVFDRHWIPIMFEEMKEGDIVRLSTDYQGFSDLVDRITAYYVGEQLTAFKAKGMIPTPEELVATIESTRQKLMGNKDLFVKLVKKVGKDMCDTKVYITNEEMDTGVMADKLSNAMKMAPEYKDFILSQLFDVLGLQRPRRSPQLAPAPGQMPPAGQNGAPPAPGGAPAAPSMPTAPSMPAPQSMSSTPQTTAPAGY